MQLGTLSVSVSLGLDGTWIDVTEPSTPGGPVWPTPSELAELSRHFRHVNIVDRAMLTFLEGKSEGTSNNDNIVVADVSKAVDHDDIIGTERTTRLLEAANGGFVHVAGGAQLTRFALATGLVRELDVTLYPVVGGKHANPRLSWCDFRRLHVQAHDDGRVTTVWRRD